MSQSFYSLPEPMDFKLFGKTILVVNKKFRLFLAGLSSSQRLEVMATSAGPAGGEGGAAGALEIAAGEGELRRIERSNRPRRRGGTAAVASCWLT